MKDTAVRPERVEELSKEMSVALSKDLQSLRSINMKTRLLSINAQIEAARAGEAGLAFAVVAGEVMELARNMDSSFHNLESETAPLLNELEELGARLAKDVKGQRLADLAATHLDLIDRNLYERTCDVRWWATDGGLVKAMETRSPEDLSYASQRMGTILDSYTVYFDLVLCDMDGMVIANGRPNEYHSVGTDMSRQEWFLSGKKTMDGSEYGFEGVHKTILAGGEKVLVYSTAVRTNGQENGRPIGVLGVVFRWDALGQTIVENAAIPKEEMDHTRVLILEPDGRVIAANDGFREGEKLPLQNWLVKDTTSARYHFTHEWRGAPAIISVARSQGYETYSTGWVSVIIQKIETLNSFSNSSPLSSSYSSTSSIGSTKHSFIGV